MTEKETLDSPELVISICLLHLIHPLQNPRKLSVLDSKLDVTKNVK